MSLQVKQMREDGLHLKKSALALQHHVDMAGDRPMLHEDPSEFDFIRNLTLEKKIKLLKKLKKLTKEKKRSPTSSRKGRSSKKYKKKTDRNDEWVEKG